MIRTHGPWLKALTRIRLLNNLRLSITQSPCIPKALLLHPSLDTAQTHYAVRHLFCQALWSTLNTTCSCDGGSSNPTPRTLCASCPTAPWSQSTTRSRRLITKRSIRGCRTHCCDTRQPAIPFPSAPIQEPDKPSRAKTPASFILGHVAVHTAVPPPSYSKIPTDKTTSGTASCWSRALSSSLLFKRQQRGIVAHPIVAHHVQGYAKCEECDQRVL